MQTGIPNDDEEDKNLTIWSGIIPIPSKRLTPIGDENSDGIEMPGHLR